LGSVSTSHAVFFFGPFAHRFSKGTLFAKRFEEAVLMNAKQLDLFEKFSATFPSITIKKWENMVEKWESNRNAPNPYNEVEKSMFLVLNSCYIIFNLYLETTLQDARLELAREETIRLASGCAPRHKVSVIGFFSMGFDIEDQQ
jgi:hypothetical protein